jgi:hypothetical protein
MGPSLFPPPWLAGPATGADFFKSALATTTNPAKLSQITSYKLTEKRLVSSAGSRPVYSTGLFRTYAQQQAVQVQDKKKTPEKQGGGRPQGGGGGGGVKEGEGP